MVRQWLMVLTFGLVISSCATLFSRKYDEINFDSSPQGAKVYIDGEYTCKTPCRSEVRRRLEGAPIVDIKLKGYVTESVELSKTVTVAALFNIGFITTSFGASSWGLDALSGAMFEYQNKSYFIELSGRNSADNKSINPSTFIALNYDAIRAEIAKSDGRLLEAYFVLVSENSDKKEFYKNIKENSSKLLAIQAPSELHKSLLQLL